MVFCNGRYLGMVESIRDLDRLGYRYYARLTRDDSVLSWREIAMGGPFAGMTGFVLRCPE